LSADAPNPPTGPEVVLRSVTVGRYTVELGDRDGAKLEALDGGKHPVALAQAIARVEAGQGTPRTGVEVLERDVGVAERVTTAIELARELFVQVAQGRPPDVTTIDSAVEMLLGLLQRLDLDEHWEEAVRVARELAMLLALLERWMELLQSLQTALRGAEKAKDLGGHAWALHEQGTWQLAAGNHAKADCLLDKAHDLREQIHDRSGLRMTDHNLQVLCKTLRADLHGHSRPPPPPPPPFPPAWFPLRPLPVLVLAILLLALGGVAGAIVRGVANGESGQRARSVPVKGLTTDGPGTAKKVEVSAVPKSVPGGTAATEITAKALTADGEPLSGQSVKFAVKPEDGTFSPHSAITNAVGNAQTKLTFTSSRTSAVEDTVEACASGGACNTAHVLWEIRSTPIAATLAPSDVTSTAATLNGTLNPNDATVTSCYFEYGAGTSYEHTAPCASYKSSGSSPEGVSAPIESLVPHTLYRVRLVADSVAGAGGGQVETFTTPEATAKQKPSVVTEGNGEPTSSSASVTGSVSPSGSDVEKCEFLYTIVRDADFATPTMASVECSDFTPGAGTSAVAVTAQLSNLAPDQLYDYHLLATVEGTSYDGGSRSFKTAQAPSP